MKNKISLNLKQYSYTLPNEKIAIQGSTQRDSSKLLFFNEGKIYDHYFHQIVDLIPHNSTLVFNDTKVIPARLKFQKSTGATIELLLLKPTQKTTTHKALNSTKGVTWECLIGNIKKWKKGEFLTKEVSVSDDLFTVTVFLLDKEKRIVKFEWGKKNITFKQIINILGSTPLPPYIKRTLNEEDKERYQTVYSKVDGAVAAPTAGLHFTKKILEELNKIRVKQEHLTLHIGAGTFMPIKSSAIDEHPMHNETIIVTKKMLESLIQSEFIVAVGTTSVRALESIYWFGVKLIKNPNEKFKIEKLYPYEERLSLPSKNEAIQAVLIFLKNNNLETIEGCTEILIFPGYIFKVCSGLITNFHQPKSTLILLIAAFVGDKWEYIYNHALQHDYHFLSYGDSCLLIPSK